MLTKQYMSKVNNLKTENFLKEKGKGKGSCYIIEMLLLLLIKNKFINR